MDPSTSISPAFVDNHPTTSECLETFAGRIVSALVLTLALMLAATTSLAEPEPHQPIRVGFLVLSPLSDAPSAERAVFFDRLAELGFADGDNIDVIYRSAEWDLGALEKIAQELVDLEVSLIIAVTGEAAQAAQQFTGTIPILFVPSAAPLAGGLVDDLARPNRNLTGISLYAPDLGAKRLDLLHEAYPDIRRVAVLWSEENPSLHAQAESTRKAAEILGLKLAFFDVGSPEKLSAAFETMWEEPPDALVAFTDSRMVSYRQLIADFSLTHRLPTMFGLRRFVDAGGLLSYGPNLPLLFQRAAGLAARILEGSDPRDLPVIQPKLFQLVINLETARTLGRPIAASVLIRADEVVE